MEIWEFVGWILAVYITLCVAGLLVNLLVPSSRPTRTCRRGNMDGGQGNLP